MEIKQTNFLDKKLIKGVEWLTIEKAIYIAFILIGILTRSIMLGARPMSHDESLHTYFSYLLSQGQGYQHNPMMHGPLQFHLIALSYFLFGSSDFVSRIPAATFGVLAIGALWLWRRYLGRYGAIIAGLMVLISPFLTYYSRYTREDPYVALSLIVMLYATLRYFEKAEPKFLYLISGSFIIHYLTKETSFIYNAEMLIFLALLFILFLVRHDWNGNNKLRAYFMISLLASIVFLLLTFIAYTQGKVDTSTSQLAAPSGFPKLLPYLLGAFGVTLASGIFFVIRGLGFEEIRKSRSFDLLIVYGTLVLPQLSAFPVYLLGNDPMDYSAEGLGKIAIFLIPFILVTIVIGFLWNKQVWPKIAMIFYIPYLIFYSTFFTNGIGVISGMVGSLGYWLTQQGVERGSQPFYYYPLITIPLYEFLPAIAALIAVGFGIAGRKKYINFLATESEDQEFSIHTLVFSLLTYWSIMSVIAFSIAGEKMPWLTYHMALPLILLGAWGIRKIIEQIDWQPLLQDHLLEKIALSILFVISAIGALLVLLDAPTPFTGKDMPTLIATTSLIAAVVFMLGSFYILRKLSSDTTTRSIVAFGSLFFIVILFLITARVSYRANFVKFNSGQEYLVYAHSYTGTTDLLTQLNEISEKTVGGKDIMVAYDDDTSWPMSWYMREYPNNRFYGGQPDRSLRDYTAIIVGDNNYTKLEPILRDDFYQFDYIRMVWPNQDYFNLITPRSDPTYAFDEGYACKGILSPLRLIRSYDFSRLCAPILSADYRSAIFQIWLNGDFTKYAEVTGNANVKETTWEPTDKMRLYVKKDVIDQLWSYGVKIEASPRVDPYADKYKTIYADQFFGAGGSGDGEFNAPRDIALAADGSVYITDSRNHRVQHFSPDGKFLNSFGSYGDSTNGSAPLGSLNEPWGVAVSQTGEIYVSDTWNHRIQKFSSTGEPMLTWGTFGTSETTGGLYGPRGIAISQDDRVFVADTGNARVLIYDQEGNQLGTIGSAGFEVGQFSEPVDVTIDDLGNIYVTDTWNQRVQVFSEIQENVFTPIRSWEIDGWDSQSLDNKPYITADQNTVLVSDPEGYRVLAFTPNGDILYIFGEYGVDTFNFGLPSGLTLDQNGGLWVVDSGNNRVMRFMLEGN